MVKNHRDLTVWQKAVDLVMEVNHLITKLPRDEKFALADQLRRAALSIPSNIAEGRARSSDRDYLRFLYMARGSLAEIDTQLYIAVKMKYFTDSDVEFAINLHTEVAKMLNKMISTLNNKIQLLKANS